MWFLALKLMTLLIIILIFCLRFQFATLHVLHGPLINAVSGPNYKKPPKVKSKEGVPN